MTALRKERAPGSFRARMTMLTTVVFLLAAVGLVAALNLIVRAVIGQSSTIEGPSEDTVRYEVIDGRLTPVSDAPSARDTYALVGIEQLMQLLWWSLLLVAVFAVVAWGLSRWTVATKLVNLLLS